MNLNLLWSLLETLERRSVEQIEFIKCNPLLPRGDAVHIAYGIFTFTINDAFCNTAAKLLLTAGSKIE